MIKLGKRHVELFTKWLPSATVFGMTGGIAVCYASEWKAVLQYLPYYGGKFKAEE